MKRVFIFFVFISAARTEGLAQTENNANAVMVAQKIANKMQDSLGLATAQKSQIYAINMQLHEQKQAARRSNTDQNSLTRQIQQIENTRDSLYRTILPDEKYQLYRQKKRNLISNK